MVNLNSNWSSDCKTKYVHTGEIVISSGNDKLVSTPLGSCVAVLAYDLKAGISGMAHIMLPGKAPKDSPHPLRYAEDAIDKLLEKLAVFGSTKDSISICLAGGGNVLNKSENNISKQVVDSVIDALDRRQLAIGARHLGGFERRSMIYYNSQKSVFYKVGNEKETILCKF